VGFDQPAPDPRNPRRVDFGFAAASDLRMPGWPAAPHLDDPAEGAPRGTLDSFQFRSEILGNARDIKVYRPIGYGTDPAKRYPVVVITHGDNVLRGGRGLNTLDNVVGTSVEPLVAVFVPRAGRGEFGGPDTDKFVSFLTDELLPHVDRHYTTDPTRRAIMGPASAGVTAVYAALSRPDIFPRVGVQSFYEIAATKEALDGKLAASGPKPKFAIVVSSTHDYAIPGGPEAAPPTASLLKALRAAGIETTELAGTHSPNWIGWAGQDDDILQALFPAPAAP
jgi:enterochelin esterase-like enzyme